MVTPKMLCRFAGEPEGDAQHMMEVALSLEKLSFRRLRMLHDIAVKHDDAEMADFLGEPPCSHLSIASLVPEGLTCQHSRGLST